MGKKLLLVFFLFVFITQAQLLKLQGNAYDSTIKQGLPNVILMALKFSDSSLVNHSRTNSQGIFKPISIPLDTYLVILSHPSFSDRTYLLIPNKNDSLFTFKNVVLPPKSFELNEVEIIAYKDKSYYKGDTLIFTADSFKTRPNATVEDLLKKLPGIKVDAAGKITIQGKQVDQVLVDGDEFFGSDPTLATRNLNASSIENVQVYDKKNESTEEGKEETVKVVNLKLKEDAKKGYFGKASAASDAQTFYENELLFNKFKNSRKLSLFGLMANTPKQAFDWGEINKYGLNGEQDWSYDEESGNWNSNREQRTGKPQTGKAGFYYTDKIEKKTKINSDYTFNQNQLQAGEQNNTQFFLTDTSYTNSNNNSSSYKNQNHGFNFRYNRKLDSLTELTIIPKAKYALNENNSIQSSEFISQEGILTRSTKIANKNNGEKTDVNIQVLLEKDFKKKDRNLRLNYQPVYSQGSNTSNLNTTFNYFLQQAKDSSLNQQRTQNNTKLEHNASMVYIEPLSKKFKAEFSYNFSSNQTSNNRQTFDFSGITYDIFNPVLSNNFENKRMVNRAGTRLIYEVKKYRISVGSNFRRIQQQNVNLTTNQKLNLNVDNILPNASFNFRINKGSNLNIRYNTSSQQPEILQMQPVVDNSNPNRINIGNPKLKPTFSQNGNLNYYFYKGISDVNMYAGANVTSTNRQICDSTTFDDLGRVTSQPVNIDGNYNGNMYLGGGFPVFKKFMKIEYNFNGGFSNNASYVNGIKNITQNTFIGPGLRFEKQTPDFEISIGGNYNYNKPYSKISSASSQPYYTYGLSGNVLINFPKKFSVISDAEYTNNGNRSPGYNLNYLIWNASLNKTLLKNENLVISMLANDILNQNISNNRYISGNQIVDNKTQIIKRYFLFKILYKINSQKKKEEDEED